MPTSAFESTAIALGVRPTRAALFVPLLEGIPWQRMMASALATQTLFWGGSGNLPFFLPDESSDDELFWALLDLFDPDAFLVYNPANGEMETLNPEWYEARRAALDPEGLIGDAAWDHWRADHDLLVGFPEEIAELLVRRLAPLHHDDSPQWDYVSGFDESPPFLYTNAAMLRGMPGTRPDGAPVPLREMVTTVGDTEQLLLTSEVGALSPGASAVIDALDLPGGRRALNTRLEWADFLYRPRNRDVAYPLMISEFGLGWYRARPPSREPIVLVTGEQAWDFVLFYALLRLTGRAYWVPPSVVNDDIARDRLARALVRLSVRGGRSGLRVVSTSDPHARGAVIERLRERIPPQDRQRLDFSEIEWRDALPDDPNRLFERERFGRHESVLLQDGVSPELVTPLPRVDAEDPSELHWMTDIRVDGWAAVRNRRLGPRLVQIPNYDSHWVRTSAEGPSYFCPHFMWFGGRSLEMQTVRPRVHRIDLLGQVQHILSQQGWEGARSDKGIYAAESANLAGGYADLAALLHAGTAWSVIRAFRDPGAPGRTISADQRRYLRMSDAVELVGEPQAKAVLADLEERGVLTRGLLFKCRRCRAAAFYSLGEASETFRCARCRLTQSPSRTTWLDPTEPVWHYQLAEVVYQLLQHDGDVALFTGVEGFEAQRDRPRALAFEVDVFDSDGRKSEHDVVLADGYRLWVGETTKSDRFEVSGPAQLERFGRLQTVVERLDAYGVILATSQPAFWNQVAAQARALFRHWPRLRIREGVPPAGGGV